MRTATVGLSLLLCGCALAHSGARDSGTPDAAEPRGPRDAGRPPTGYRCSPSPGHDERHCHFFTSAEDAWEAGVALYLPFSLRNLRESAVLDEGGYFPGVRYPFEGTWEPLAQEVQERWGPRADLNSASLDVRFPLTPRIAFTMLVVLDGSRAERGRHFTWSTTNGAGCTRQVAIDDGAACEFGGWCMRSSPACEAAAVETPLRVELTSSGALMLFLTWAEDELEVRSGRHRVSVPWADGIRTPVAAPTQIGPARLLSLVVWDRVLAPETMSILWDVDSEISDGF